MGLAAAADLNNFGIVGVLGAPLHDQGAGNAGMVYVFDLEVGGMGTTRTEIAKFQPPGLGSGARFGMSIALYGPDMSVGAPGFKPDGAVFLYERGATIADWILAGQLTPPGDPDFIFGDGFESGDTSAWGAAAGALLAAIDHTREFGGRSLVKGTLFLVVIAGATMTRLPGRRQHKPRRKDHR